VRVAFFALLLANLLYMGWAEWIDVPGPPPPSPTAGLRPLTLVKDLPPDKRADLAKKMALAMAPPPQCVSVGPFDDPAVASQAAALLRAKSFAPQQRAAQSPATLRFWVYLDGFASDAAVTKALHKLERGRIDDAEAMPPEAGGRRISLGLFNDRDHAESRAKLVHTIGFRPAITERLLPGTVYWLDLTLPNGSAPVPLKDVSDLQPGGGSAPISVQSCPSGAAPATAPVAPSPLPTAPAPHKAATSAAVDPKEILPRCKPGGGGPVPCIVLKEAKQPSVL
jgi:SPOR domain